jgi:hypothetical protein
LISLRRHIISALLLTVIGPGPLYSQSSPVWAGLGAHAVPAFIHTDPVPFGGTLGEVRLLQPALMAHASALGNRLRFMATVNFEGLTIPGGELALGDWGEGFVDRRHPHTYLHEAIVSWNQPLGPGVVSLALGKGFAPFGTDDPMSRPVLRYPVNHHLAQILERAVLIIGARTGPVLLEGSLFNGDEPERPSQWPKVSRFGDSWSARLTVFPRSELEVQGSLARVNSPEHRPGFGTDQAKWSLSGRWSGLINRFPLYGLIEWARTSEANGFFVFSSLLAEGAWSLDRSRLHYRFERTERPEEARAASSFRSSRPHVENSILGTTRWTVQTVGYAFQLQPRRDIGAQPFLELSYGRMSEVGGGLFQVQPFYGKTSFWSVSAGTRITLGLPLHRMGRYGVAQNTAQGSAVSHHGHHDN